jgi:tetratricopeptide (TPR) repeat protein
VLARRQTWRYLAAGFVRRHRVGVALAAGMLALLLAGLYGSAMLAARNAQHAERIARVLDTFTMLLTEADPYEGSPGTVTVGKVVDAASERLLAERSGDPDFDLALLERLAALQADLRNPAQQLSLLAAARERAAGAADGEAARQRITAAEIAALGRLGRYDEAERALADYRRHWPEPLPLRLALNEARLHLDRGDFDQAAQLLDALLTRVPADARLLRYDILAERGYLLKRRARYQEALAVFEQAGTLLDATDLAQRRISLRHRANYANALGLAGRQAEAATLFAGLRDEYAARLGADHPRVVQLTINIAQMLTLSAQPQQALREVQNVDLEAIARHDARLAAMAGVQRGRAALYAGSLAQVMPAYLDALEISIAAIGPDAPGLAPFLEPLAFALFAFGEDALAVAVAQRARALDPEVTVVSDLLLEWLGERMSVTGRPDLGFAGRLKSECDRVEYQVVRARLTGLIEGELPGEVPADCGTPSAVLLEGLGLVWDAPAGIPTERTIALPLLARLSAQPLPEGARLTAEDRVRIEAWLAEGESR